MEGISLHPDDWIKNQQSLCSSRLDKSSSVTPVVSPPSTQEKTEGLSPPAACESNPLALADDDVSSDETETKTETNNSDDSSDGQEVKVCVGETEKLAARCKLQVTSVNSAQRILICLIGVSITVRLTFCFTGWDSVALHILN